MKTVDKVLAKYYGIVDELKQVEKQQASRALMRSKVHAFLNVVHAKVFIWMKAAMDESLRARREAARIQRVLSGE